MPEGRAAVHRESRTSWLLLLDWGVVVLTLVSAGASAFAALIAFHQDDTSAMAEAILAFGAALGAAWLGRTAARAARAWQEELVSWQGNDIVLLADDAGRILDANDRAVEAYGLPIDALFRRHVATLRHATGEDGLEKHLDELRANGRVIFETVHRRADGAPFPVQASARAFTAQGHRLLHLIVRDVTEAHRARERLVAAERLAAVGSVAAGVAHDINNPLCGVLGNLTFALESLGDERPDLPEVRKALGEARESALRVRDTVRELEAFFRDNPGAGAPTPAAPSMAWSPKAGLAAAMGLLAPPAPRPGSAEPGTAAAPSEQLEPPAPRPRQ